MNSLLQCTLGVVLIFFVMTPVAQTEDHTCTVQYDYWGTEVYPVYQRQRYTIRCGWCGTQRCARYRQSSYKAYRRRLWTSKRTECCTGWRSDRYGKCTMPICNPSCHPTRGKCVQPNVCQCQPGYTGATCSEDINECQGGNNVPPCDQICVNSIGSYRCECQSGYSLNDNQPGCTDIDECSMTRTHNCHQECNNTLSSYVCDCYDGYMLNLDGKSCEDTDECAQMIDECEQLCVNRRGAANRCECKMGYELHENGHNCTDINECVLGTPSHDCSQKCINGEGNFTCFCNHGYELGMDGKTCFDIDECAPTTMNCDMIQICDTTSQITACTFVRGFMIDIGNCTSDPYYAEATSGSRIGNCTRQDYNCSDLQICQETSDDVKCVCVEQAGHALSMEPSQVGNSSTSNVGTELTRCLHESGTFTCIELSGDEYQLVIDNQFCQGEKKHDCNEMQVCKNIEGGFECPCKEGYTKDNVTGECDDIDECSTDYMNCPDQHVQICVASNDNITCECHEGEVSLCDGNCVKDCVGLEVCLENTCTCYPNYFLNDDNKPCKGGGCGEMIHDCTDMEYCNNTVGGYDCHCVEGYIRNDVTGLCSDVDECLGKTDKCNHLCMNLVGNYSCDCVEGYSLEQNGYTCFMPMGLREAYVALKQEGGLDKAADVTFESASEWYLLPLGMFIGIGLYIGVVIGRKKSNRFRMATDVPIHAIQSLRGRVANSTSQIRGRYSIRGGVHQSNVYMSNPAQQAPNNAEDPPEDATIYSPNVVVAEM